MSLLIESGLHFIPQSLTALMSQFVGVGPLPVHLQLRARIRFPPPKVSAANTAACLVFYMHEANTPSQLERTIARESVYPA